MCSEGELSINTHYALKEADRYEKICLEDPNLYQKKIEPNELEAIMLAVTYNNENKAGYLGGRVKTYADLITTLRDYANY